MNLKVAICLVATLAFSAIDVMALENTPTDQEDAILVLILKCPANNWGCTVVQPNTEKMGRSNQDIAKQLETNGVSVSGLVKQLFERNLHSVRLSIKSSPKDGYIFDNDGKYEKYFAKGGGGWEKWYQDNPKLHGLTTVSLPVYDKTSGLVLVYLGTQYQSEGGEGWIILYSYKQGELKELNRISLWVS
jgi:hypothetical protein